MMAYVIGCGGGGGKLAMILAALGEALWLVDGDHIEEKNLDRQFFPRDMIGINKAEALASLLYKQFDMACDYTGEFYHTGNDVAIEADDVLLCCADNHPCRLAVIETCDAIGCLAIIGGNDEFDAEAYVYWPALKGTPNDPRIYYPDLVTNKRNDPLMPGGCTGQEAIDENPQLVVANAISADFMAQLFYFHTRTVKGLDRDSKNSWPVHLKTNKWCFNRSITYGERLAKVIELSRDEFGSTHIRINPDDQGFLSGQEASNAT